MFLCVHSMSRLFERNASFLFHISTCSASGIVPLDLMRREPFQATCTSRDKGQIPERPTQPLLLHHGHIMVLWYILPICLPSERSLLGFSIVTVSLQFGKLSDILLTESECAKTKTQAWPCLTSPCVFNMRLFL
jgi:hypothetical protein